MPNDKDWKSQARCLNWDVNLFFDKYEEDLDLRKDVDEFCSTCPVMRQCFAYGVSTKQTGVWGGIYLDRGKISREYNKHKTKEDWGNTWSDLTIDKEQDV
jgi:hypothetical protein